MGALGDLSRSAGASRQRRRYGCLIRSGCKGAMFCDRLV